jgi:hypothetical protein
MNDKEEFDVLLQKMSLTGYNSDISTKRRR